MKYIIDDALGRTEAENRIKPSSMIQNDEELVAVLEELTTVIRVIGCGGGGSNTIDRLAECGIQGAELFAINTDAQHLLHINADRRFLIGRRTTRGLGAGSLPAIGEEAAQEDIDEIKAAVNGADMIFVTCGLGGGTGTGASPVVAEAAREAGALTIAIVTIPFSAEGSIRMQNAEAGLKRLREVSDTVIVVPNDRLLDVVPNLPLQAAFKVADEVLMRSVKGITELITRPGLINLDFADVRTVMTNGGVDTAMPDKIVRKVVGRIFQDARLEMEADGDLSLIETVKELGQATGYRSLDICWMCWLISVACPSREKVDAVL